MNIKSLRKELVELKNSEKAKILQKFFKTGKGEYGEGDIFLGITVPQSRQISKKYSAISFPEIKKLLNSKIHEERLIALLILVHNYKKDKSKIFSFYLKNTKFVNNWDLVDLSAPNIVGNYLLENPKLKPILKKLARSSSIWERRISIVSTLAFIREEKLSNTLALSVILIKDKHDLIHKAVGWMLRELGKKDLESLECFLRSHYKKMPRTMLRYAIEKFPKEKKLKYLKGKI